MPKPVTHPTTHAQFVEAHKRWMKLKQAHTKAAELMWAGVLVTQFSDHELKLLSEHSMMCVRDHQLLNQSGRPIANEQGTRTHVESVNEPPPPRLAVEP